MNDDSAARKCNGQINRRCGAKSEVQTTVDTNTDVGNPMDKAQTVAQVIAADWQRLRLVGPMSAKRAKTLRRNHTNNVERAASLIAQGSHDTDIITTTGVSWAVMRALRRIAAVDAAQTD